MIKITKKKKKIRSIIDFKKKYTFNESINILKKFQTIKFNESIDTAIHLGIDPKKSDQNIRGSTVLPHGTGKNIKIAVFTKGNNIEKAKKSGANIVGGEELIKTITKKNINFDIVIASPDIMNIVGKLGPILGPKGLMPNLKMGTITKNIEKTIKNIKKGQIIYKNDKNGIIHSTIGKINFSNQHLKENFINLIESLKKNKPTQSKGIFIKKIILSSTMGAGISIEINSIDEK